MSDVNTVPAEAGAQAAVERAGQADDGDVLLQVENLVKYFPVAATGFFQQREHVHAVDNVSFTVRRGQTFGIVGETGCGKSTLGRSIARLHDITSGRILFDGQDISRFSQRRMRPLRREIQMVFQDPMGSLNPRRRVGSIIGDPFAIHKIASGTERKRHRPRPRKTGQARECGNHRNEHRRSADARHRCRLVLANRYDTLFYVELFGHRG